MLNFKIIFFWDKLKVIVFVIYGKDLIRLYLISNNDNFYVLNGIFYNLCFVMGVYDRGMKFCFFFGISFVFFIRFWFYKDVMINY